MSKIIIKSVADVLFLFSEEFFILNDVDIPLLPVSASVHFNCSVYFVAWRSMMALGSGVIVLAAAQHLSHLEYRCGI
jgi:hypothetical protein